MTIIEKKNNKIIQNLYLLKKLIKIGILFSSFGVSALFYNIFCTYIVNPNNLKATIKVKEGENLMKYFNKAVTDNTPTMIFTMALS